MLQDNLPARRSSPPNPEGHERTKVLESVQTRTGQTIAGWVSLAFMFSSSLVFGLADNIPAMGISATAGALSLAFCNLQKIARFKGAGFEAEMKQAVEEAYATIDQLRQLVRPIAVSMINTINYSNRFGGMGKERQWEYVHDLEDLARRMKVDMTAVDSALEEFHVMTTWDLFGQVTHQLGQKGPMNDAIEQELLAMPRRSRESLPPTPASLDSLINPHREHLTVEAKEALDCYRFYYENRRLLSIDKSS